MDLSDTDKERFWSKVDKTGECWLWTGSCNRFGHGQFSFNGKICKAHRVSWFIAGNTCPEGHVIRHKCRAANCVNPAHLETGTKAQNNADRIRDGTSTRGTKSSSCKLTEAQVLEIFASNKSYCDLAKEYGISRHTPGKIKSGKRWGWLTMGTQQ
jgi:hypothetical protein